MEDVRARLAALNAEPAGGTSKAFGEFLVAERVKWGGVIREAGIRPE